MTTSNAPAETAPMEMFERIEELEAELARAETALVQQQARAPGSGCGTAAHDGAADRITSLEAELAQTAARANAAVARAEERVYWLDRWRIDLNALLQRRGARITADDALAAYRLVPGPYTGDIERPGAGSAVPPTVATRHDQTGDDRVQPVPRSHLVTRCRVSPRESGIAVKCGSRRHSLPEAKMVRGRVPAVRVNTWIVATP